MCQLVGSPIGIPDVFVTKDGQNMQFKMQMKYVRTFGNMLSNCIEKLCSVHQCSKIWSNMHTNVQINNQIWINSAKNYNIDNLQIWIVLANILTVWHKQQIVL